MAEPAYMAIIGDLVESRKLENRAAVQESLRAALTELNETFREHLQARLIITIGDEFQGLAAPDFPFDHFWWAYQRLMRPHVLTRLSLGLGGLATALQPDAIGMDGPCFHAARAGLEAAHAEDRHLVIRLADRPKLGEALTAAAAFLDAGTQHWTAVQWETVCLLRKLGSQVEVARARGVAKQSVHDALSACQGEAAIESLRGIVQIIGQAI